jgi:hypothetical protein
MAPEGCGSSTTAIGLDSAAAGSMVIASTVLSIVTMAIAISVLFPN